MKRRRWIIAAALIGTVLVITGVVVSRKWNQPLGASMGLPTRTPEGVRTESSAESATLTAVTSAHDNQDTPVIKETAMVSTVTPAPTDAKPVCGGPPLMYILGVGVDTRDPNYLYGLADVIRIVRVDFVTPKVTVLTLPRDLWVELPDIVDKYADTVTHGKLNQAYLYGGPGMGYYEGPGGGPGLLAHTIAHNYGLLLDHYGAVNMAAFERIVDALGGIDIYLEQDWDGRPVDDHTVDLGYFLAGQHHMTGAEALRFARIRKLYSEVTRTDNQTLVICALKDKMLDPSVVGKIPDLITALIGTIQTDLSPAQIRQLVCLLPKLEKENLQFIRFPDEKMVQGHVYDPNLGDNTFVWDIPIEDIQQFIRDFENDAIPVESNDGMSCP